MTIRYLIVDDEAPGRMNLRLAMAAHPGWELVAECGGAAAAREALARHAVDLVFLDIQMPGQSGLTLAREISRMLEPPLIVFVTAYSEHAIEAFEVHALDYLLKPLDDARLAQAVERSAAMLRQRQREAYGAAVRGYVDADKGEKTRYPDAIGVRSVGRIEQVSVREILRIESAGNYVELHLAGRSVLHRIPLSRLEGLLAPDEFVRVHRGTIVRRSEIARLAIGGDGSYSLTLRCGATVAVSERYAGALKTILTGQES
ncbi:LytTR family DNA-binding domain-containing protein [Massilia sp. IC2-477]|uniref:LytR/AlgR family response regulator transcription factor n=1 Tax=Massilia sp. IC2-477 TaxID=2887198 RepID=UPI001D110120|nr:LytTR family DNA-binding domain-containing protein [Massilia sp. IC2-477]MCC2956118.1 LytTR family DNA-binding domain-containing protein [Massilia sp. IC2-477]